MHATLTVIVGHSDVNVFGRDFVITVGVQAVVDGVGLASADSIPCRAANLELASGQVAVVCNNNNTATVT